MHFTLLSFIAGLAAVATAQSTDNPFKIENGFMVTAGKPATIQWTPTTQGPVSLTLRSGAKSNLDKGTVIASSIPNTGSYTFTLPADTTRNSDYALAIAPVSNPSDQNFTPQFVVESSNTVESITPSGSSAATASTTSKASSTSTTASSAKSSSTKSGSSTTGSSSSSSSAAATGQSTSAAPAPTSGSAVHNLVNVQGGLAAVLLGAAAVL